MFVNPGYARHAYDTLRVQRARNARLAETGQSPPHPLADQGRLDTDTAARLEERYPRRFEFSGRETSLGGEAERPGYAASFMPNADYEGDAGSIYHYRSLADTGLIGDPFAQ